jgi:hypothetical protein
MWSGAQFRALELALPPGLFLDRATSGSSASCHDPLQGARPSRILVQSGPWRHGVGPTGHC